MLLGWVGTGDTTIVNGIEVSLGKIEEDKRSSSRSTLGMARQWVSPM